MDIDIGSLNVWLIDKIKPLCVADPIPLSQYITALVRKDKPITELINLCNEQLEVFLEDKTKSFVSDLFAALNSKSYMSASVKEANVAKSLKHKGRSKRADENHGKSPNKKIRKMETNTSSNPRNRSHSPNSLHPITSAMKDENKIRSSRSKRSRSGSSDSLQRSKTRRQGTRRVHSDDSSSDSSSGHINRRKRKPKASRIQSEAVLPPQPVMQSNNENREFSSVIMNQNNNAFHGPICNIPQMFYDHRQNEINMSTSMWSDGIAAQKFSQWSKRRPKPHLSPPKNIISVPLTGNVPTSTIGYEPTYPSEGPESAPKQNNGVITPIKPIENSNAASTDAPVEYKPSPIVDSVDENSAKKQCSSILVTRIPWHLNNHKNLSEHFSQFGRIVNICTNFQNAEHKALVEFASPLEADAAYRSPEAVLNNRFVRLHLWGASKFQKGQGNVKQRLGLNKPFDLNKISDNKKSRTTGTRSRFRLERGSNLEDSEDEELIEELNEDSPTAFLKNTVDSNNDDSSWVTQLNRKFVRHRQLSESTKIENDAKRELVRQQALKEHKEKLERLEQAKEARNKLCDLLSKKLEKLTASLKETISEIENIGKDESALLRKRELYKKAKSMQNEMDSVNTELAIAMGRKTKISSKPSSIVLFKSVLDSDAVNEKMKKIEDINCQINELMTKKKEAELENPQMTNTIVREIVLLKRQLVEIETIKQSDLNAQNNNSRTNRIQTKIDKRPKTLYISPFTRNDFENYVNLLKSRFLHTESITPFIDPNFVDVPGVDPDVVLEVTFCTRDFAETAMRCQKTFMNRPLTMTFNRPEGLDRKLDKSVLNSPVIRNAHGNLNECEVVGEA